MIVNLLIQPNFFTLRSQPALPQASTKSHSRTLANSTNFLSTSGIHSEKSSPERNTTESAVFLGYFNTSVVAAPM